MDPIYQHTLLHNDPMVAAQLRDVRIATSTVREADSTRKRVRAASTQYLGCKFPWLRDRGGALAILNFAKHVKTYFAK